MFQAIEIDGEPYWDGGFAGNPTITPLIRESDAQDTILIQINPRERPGTPRSAAEILNRLNEVSFNATLMKELRMIALMRQVADPGSGEGKRWSQMRMHRITTELMTDLGYSSKLNGERDFLWMLRDEGRRAASAFLSDTRAILANARPPISTCCWQSAEIMDLLGILGALGLLIWLAFRGWSVLLLAPCAALVAAAAAGEPLLAHWTSDLHAQRRRIPGTVLSAVSARGAVRQADGRQRFRAGDRQLHDRKTWDASGGVVRHPSRRNGHLWRRQPASWRFSCLPPWRRVRSEPPTFPDV